MKQQSPTDLVSSSIGHPNSMSGQPRGLRPPSSPSRLSLHADRQCLRRVRAATTIGSHSSQHRIVKAEKSTAPISLGSSVNLVSHSRKKGKSSSQGHESYIHREYGEEDLETDVGPKFLEHKWTKSSATSDSGTFFVFRSRNSLALTLEIVCSYPQTYAQPLVPQSPNTAEYPTPESDGIDEDPLSPTVTRPSLEVNVSRGGVDDEGIDHTEQSSMSPGTPPWDEPWSETDLQYLGCIVGQAETDYERGQEGTSGV